MKTNKRWLGALLMFGLAGASEAAFADAALPVPIPGVAALLAIGFGAFFLVRRNK